MKKQLLLRGLLGFPIGIALGYLITILVSLGWGDGAYAPCMPALADAMGSEIGAVMLQALLCGLLPRMAGGKLEPRQANGRLFWHRFAADAADRLRRLLDGAQPDRLRQLLWYFRVCFCSDLDQSICAGQAQRQKNE